MILDRILKGFWGRYALYLSAFVALYFLMREKLDSIIFSLWDSWITVGEHPYLSIYLFCLLLAYPLYRIVKKREGKQVVNAAYVAYLFIPISAWYVIQLVWQTDKYYYLKGNDAFYIVLCFTILYALILIFTHINRDKAIETGQSLLLKDEPIKKIEDDKLGFALYVDSISTNILNIANIEEPFIFGIQGRWGSGKTSFINLVKANLKKEEPILILDFNPWMSGSVQQMTSDFFSLMAESTPEMRLKMKFREYGKVLAAADGTGIVGKVVESMCPNQDLRTIRETINGCIKRQDLRFVVFIDDTDRLDKEELLSVFKLVRNTASFSNTIFVLTYDRNYVDSILTSYFENSSIAEAYTDKIVNLQFELPSSTKDYYEILRREINDSEFIKAHPEIRLNDGDLPKEITNLFDSYRKVKRVFNALAVESGLPHFEKIPVKYTLVFFYIAYYQKEDYQMMKEAYHAVNNTNWLKDHKKIGESIGQSMWRYIHESKGVFSVELGNGSNKEENKKRIENLKTFIRNHQCLSSLFKTKEKNPFVKYINFLLKFNAIHYKEYKNRYETYGIDGYKGIKLELSNAINILERLIVIQDNFPKTFYAESVIDLLELFTRGTKNNVAEKDLKQYYQFLLGLLLNINNTEIDWGVLIKRINQHYAEYNWNGKELISILEWIDDSSNINKHPFFEFFSKFSKEKRYNLTSAVYREILSNLIDPGLTLPYEKNDVLISANRHLQSAIDNKLKYEPIEHAFFACYENIDPQTNVVTLSPKACCKFRRYIEESPDDFIYNCIRTTGEMDDFRVTLHPFLLKIFDDDKLSVKQYFKDIYITTKNEKSKKTCSIIRKHINKYLSDEIQKSERKLFQISDEDFDYIFKKEGNLAIRK